MIVGCYTLDLYCDNAKPQDGIHEWNEFPHQFFDEFGSTCRSNARKAGWLLSEKRALCPKCSGKKRKA